MLLKSTDQLFCKHVPQFGFVCYFVILEKNVRGVMLYAISPSWQEGPTYLVMLTSDHRVKMMSS